MTTPDDLELHPALRRAAATLPVDVEEAWLDFERSARRSPARIAFWIAAAAVVLLAVLVPIRLLAGDEASLDVGGVPGSELPVEPSPTPDPPAPVTDPVPEPGVVPPDLRDVDVQALLEDLMPPTVLITAAPPPEGVPDIQRFDVGPSRLSVSRLPDDPATTSTIPSSADEGRGIPGASSWRTVDGVDVELILDPTSATPERVVLARFACGGLRWTFYARQTSAGVEPPGVDAIAVELAGLLPCS